MGCQSLLQGIFLTQGLNLGLPHCRKILYCLSHQGSPILSLKVKVKVESRSIVSYSLQPHELYSPWNSPGHSTGVGSLSLLQGIFPTQGLNPGFPHYRQILYQLSHKGSPKILEWVAYSFSSGSSQPGIEPGSPALQVDSLRTELSGEPNCYHY